MVPPIYLRNEIPFLMALVIVHQLNEVQQRFVDFANDVANNDPRFLSLIFVLHFFQGVSWRSPS